VAWTMLNDKTCRIYEAKILEVDSGLPPLSVSSQTTSISYVSSVETQTTAGNSYTTDGKKYLHFQCADGVLAIENLQLEGKKRMGIEEFLRGYRLVNN
jgi:methionyl-tRNA formyltransferase